MAIDTYVRCWRTDSVCVHVVGALSLAGPPEQLCGFAGALQRESGLSLSGLAELHWIRCGTQLHPETAFWHVHGGFSLLIDFPHFLACFVPV